MGSSVNNILKRLDKLGFKLKPQPETAYMKLKELEGKYGGTEYVLENKSGVSQETVDEWVSLLQTYLNFGGTLKDLRNNKSPISKTNEGKGDTKTD